MANKVSIGIDAQLDAAGVKLGIDKITQQISHANKQKLNPVDKSALANLDAVNRKFQELLKVNRELNRRVNATGQSGSMLQDLDFGAIFPDAKVRARKMSQISQHVGIPAAQMGPGVQPHPGRGGGFGAVAGQVAQAGMRAAGPAGGVAAGALGAGMSAGFGAGLMGLMGGMLALGIGKIVGGIAERVGQAEDNSVAMDKLKRSLGDVNVSFAGLKAVVDGGAENLKITYAEAGKLASQFAKLGNMRADQYTSLSSELGVGVGLARSFGLDPEQGVGVMGQVRGVGATRDVQDSKRFALLIGETIAKSDAFAQADEVIGALGSFAVSQTRNNLGVANSSGYAGAFSALVGSGIPGLDPSGAGALLGRINSSLAAGGAKGEASQYFTGMLGARRGMDVFDTQLWREGGAFSTANSTFHGRGAVSQFYDKFGLSKPSGSESLLSANLGQLKSQYGRDPKMMLNATANQMGLSMSQSAALHLIDPNQMGEMESAVGDLTKLNGAGIGNISKIFGKNPADRRGVADSLLARGDVSNSDKDAVREAMTKSEEVQKQTLARITAQYDQEQTTGKDVRDSKNALDNIKTSIADKLVPYFNEARMGIMHLAGVSKGKTTEQIMNEVIEANSKGRRDSIDGQFSPRTQGLISRRLDLQGRIEQLSETRLTGSAIYMGKPELVAEKRKERQALEAELLETDKEMKRLTDEKNKLLEQENAARIREIDEMNKQAAKRMLGEIEVTGSINQSSAETARLARSGGGGSSGGSNAAMAPDAYDELFVKYGKQYGIDPKLLKAIAMKESGMRPGIVGGTNANGTRDYGLMQHNSAFLGSRGLTGDWDKPERSIEEAAKLLSGNITRGGSVRNGVRMYNGSGPRAEAYADDVMGRYGNTKISGVDGTPLPTGGAAATAGASADGTAKVQVELLYRSDRGENLRPPQITETRVKSNWSAHGPR